MLKIDNKRSAVGRKLATVIFLTSIFLWQQVNYIWIDYADGSVPPPIATILGFPAASVCLIAAVSYGKKVIELKKRDLWYVILIILACFASFIVDFAKLYRYFGLVSNGKSVTDPWSFVYFSTMTWTTVGYGDIAPIGFSRAAASVEALLGQFVFALSIGFFGFVLREVLIRRLERSRDDIIT